MSDSPRKARLVNLVVGLIMLLFGIGISVSLITRNVSGSNLVGPISLVLIFIFLGGYEIGKFAESRYEKQSKKPKSSLRS